MYLKIRDCQAGIWVYVSDFVRLEAIDPRSVSFVMAREAEQYAKAPMTGRDLLDVLIGSDPMLQEARLMVMDEKFLMQNVLDKNYMPYRVVKCVVMEDNKEASYYVAFNTSAYLCSDHGHTMDRFIVNRGE